MGLEEIRKLKAEAGIPKVKPRKPLAKKSAKKIKQEAQERELRNGEDTELVKWYKARQKELTGQCMRCGARYNHTILAYAIPATAHILAKRPEMFPSVALHKENFIELGAQCGCHHWYDNQATWEDIALSNIWPLVLEKFRLFEPYIKERGKIPEILAQEIKPKI